MVSFIKQGISDQMDREGFSDECREPDLLDGAGEQMTLETLETQDLRAATVPLV